jgi:hypothetical protein
MIIIKSIELNRTFKLVTTSVGINSNKYFLVEFTEGGITYIGNTSVMLCIEKENYKN